MAIKASASISLSSVTDVASVTRYYLLQSSTLAAPAKPTAQPPGGSWTDTEPGYTDGFTNGLYFTDLTVFSDGTWAYAPVSLSSSYEAAKVAYNKAISALSTADAAQNAANEAQTGINNATIYAAKVETIANAAKIQAETNAANFSRVVRITEGTDGGLIVGDNQTNSSVKIKSGSIELCINNIAVATYVQDYLRLHDMQIRVPQGVGGLVLSYFETE